MLHKTFILSALILTSSALVEVNAGPIPIVERIEVAQDDSPVGELVCFKDGETFRGVAFRYTDGKEVWLVPARRGPLIDGVSKRPPTVDEVKAAWSEGITIATKGQAIFGSAFTVRVAEGGEFVHFVSNGLFGPILYEYSVSSRRVRKVGKILRD